MLCDKGMVRITFDDEPLKQRTIEIITVSLLDCKVIVVYLRAKLPIETVRTQT